LRILDQTVDVLPVRLGFLNLSLGPNAEDCAAQDLELQNAVIDVVPRRYNQTIKIAGFDLLGIHDPVRYTPPIRRLRFEVGAAFRHRSKRTRALTYWISDTP
jgi:hypothetical protein